MTEISRPLTIAALAALTHAAPALPAQSPPAVGLGKPLAATSEQFALVNTVRELGNGSLFVADPLSGDLWLFDAALKNPRKLGREGSGPGEFRQPDAVWALRNDTTLLVDLGNARLSLLDAGGRFIRSMSMVLGEFDPGRGRPPATMVPAGTDGLGRIYFQGSPMGPGGPADSVPVMRFDPSTKRVDSVGRVKAPDFDQQVSGGANERAVRIRAVPLSGGDAWAVASSGAVAFARSGQYRVDWVDASGRVVRGTPVAYDRVSIGSAEKKEWAVQQQLTGSLGMNMENDNGRISMSFARNRASGLPSTDGLKWPDTKPPFEGGTLVVDRAGQIWMRRHLPAGRPPQYDVFAANGALKATVAFPAGRRLVGFGSQGLYVVAVDEDGLQTLERYAVPIR